MISLHVDVDNAWMYEQELGVHIPINKDYIYYHSLPILLKLLQKTNSKATFMIIGQDLTLKSCQLFCKKAVNAGHEIANHTWEHPITFNSMSFQEKKRQIVKTHQLITTICGQKPVGFRAPGYYLDNDILTILKQLNYGYDTSILPGFGPFIMKSYAIIHRNKNQNKAFGKMQHIFSPQKPYKTPLLELPISTLPYLRLPIHTTFAYALGNWYRKLIIQYLKSNPAYILYLFHAIDFINLPVQNSNYPIPSLRYSFMERMNFTQTIVDTLIKINGGSLKTSRESIKTIRHSHL